MKHLKYIFIFMILFIMVVIAYLTANYILDALSREAISIARTQARAFGVHVGKITYERPWTFSIRSLTWKQLNVHLRMDGESTLFDRPHFEVLVDDIKLSVADFSSNKIALKASNFSIIPVRNAGLSDKLELGSIEGEVFEMVMTIIDIQDPLRSAKLVMQRLINLAKTGSTYGYIRFSGTTKMNIRGSMVEARVHTEDRDGHTFVVVNKHDIEKISRLFDDELTSAEIDIIIEHPAKVPLLFSIKDYAERTSKDAFARDRTVPQDPYRHVLWSYLLTKEFGPEFAEKVTDAHEEGPTGNTPMERRQDYNNNAVGRHYAKEGVQERDILQLVRTDPMVMRDWNRGSL